MIIIVASDHSFLFVRVDYMENCLYIIVSFTLFFRLEDTLYVQFVMKIDYHDEGYAIIKLNGLFYSLHL